METKSIAWSTGTGNITLTYSGQGDGPISVVSDANDGSARSQTITIQTTKGGLITKNVTVSQAACPVPVGTVLNYAYTGSYQEVELPAGQYKLQCWGAQGGSNGTNSSYGITAKAGGKGGYSEGILTLSQKTTVRVYVGGKGSASTGGFNGGGSTTGTSQYNSGNEFGYSKMGGGGGATDIRLSDGALLSRMIVAGGGSGGAMCYKRVTTTQQVTDGYASNNWTWPDWPCCASGIPVTPNTQYYMTGTGIFQNNIGDMIHCYYNDNPGESDRILHDVGGHNFDDVSPSGKRYMAIFCDTDGLAAYYGITTAELYTRDYSITVWHYEDVTTTDTNSQVGYVGGGTNGGGYSSTYQGRQNAAGNGGSFGLGANQTTTGYRYCSGAGGGGWYGGGGGQKSDSSMTYCKYSGGGSGFVNTSASAGNRPSGYTGLQLDSGSTTAGNSSFPAPGGGNETGHAGNGYARITRIS